LTRIKFSPDPVDDSDDMAQSQTQGRSVAEAKSDAERVAAFVDLLIRSVEAGRLQPSHDAARRQAETDLEAAALACLDRIGDFALRVDDMDILYSGQAIYRSAGREGSLPFSLYQDDVREIVFRRGLTPAELSNFVDAIRRATDVRHRGWDDAVTLLWEKDLPHVKVLCLPVEESDIEAAVAESGEAGAAGRIPWPGETKPDVDREPVTDEAPEGRSDDWLLPLPHSRSSSDDAAAPRPLQEIEAENIRMTASIEEAIPVRDQVLAILSELLGRETEPAEFLETASVMALFIEEAMLEGDFERAIQLGDRLRGISASRSKEPGEFGAAAEQVVRGVGRAEILRELVPLLNARTDVDLSGLTKLLAALGSSAAPILCDLLCEIHVKKVRRAICEALVISCKGDVGILIRQLSDTRWYVVRNVLYVLGRIAHQGVERALGEALYHEDIRVRREAISALAEVDSPRGRAYLNSALRDPEKDIRILVAQLISRRRSDRAAKVIWSVIESPEFEEREPEERAAFLAALGRTGSDSLVPRLERNLIRGGWPRSPDRIDRREAALALAWLGTPAALAVLKREAGSKRDDVRSAVAGALEDLRKAASKVSRTDWGH
jgi:HEAT repeat protein